MVGLHGHEGRSVYVSLRSKTGVVIARTRLDSVYGVPGRWYCSATNTCFGVSGKEVGRRSTAHRRQVINILPWEVARG